MTGHKTVEESLREQMEKALGALTKYEGVYPNDHECFQALYQVHWALGHADEAERYKKLWEDNLGEHVKGLLK